MQPNDSFIKTLNDLVRINNDRITHYEIAIEETDSNDIHLKGIFNKMANDSLDNVRELSYILETAGVTVATDTTVPCNIYPAWMDVKAALTMHL